MSRLAVAHRALADVAEAQERYLASGPYRLLHHYDPRAARYIIRVEVLHALPDYLPSLIAEQITASRAALDDLVRDIAGRADAALRFPIFESLQLFAQRSRKALRGMPDGAQAAIEALQPYHNVGGWIGHPLWTLRALADDGAPRLAAGSLGPATTIGVNTRRHVRLAEDQLPALGAFEHGTSVVSIEATVAGPDPKLDLHMRPDFALAFVARGPARGGHVVETLGDVLRHIENVVMPALERFAGGTHHSSGKFGVSAGG